MSPYRNEIPHSVVTECKVYAAESVSVIEVGMTCPDTTEFDALCFVVAEQPTGRLFIEKKRVDLVPGTFVPVNPCQPGSCDEFRRVEGAHVVCIDPELLRDICLVLYNRPHLTFPNRMVEITPEIRALRQTFITEADRGPGSSSSCSGPAARLLRDTWCALPRPGSWDWRKRRPGGLTFETLSTTSTTTTRTSVD